MTMFDDILLGSQRPRPLSRVLQRFWDKVEKTESCWLWTSVCNSKGYGYFSINQHYYLAHRLMFDLIYGPIPEGLWCLHSCDNPSCVNPEHLWLGNHADNMQDMMAKGRGFFQIHPEKRPRGDSHSARRRPETRPRGEAHGNAKLTDAAVREIRTLYATGEWTYQELAPLFGVHYSLIGYVVQRRIWAHVL